MEVVTFAADQLVDWSTALRVGGQVAGQGPQLSAIDRARLFEDFAEIVPRAESVVGSFTGLAPGTYRSRPWVMSRRQWLQANLRTFERILDPLAERILNARPDGRMAPVRRHVLGAQIGGLLGYLGRRVLGQYDVFLPPDDDGLLYLVGPNVAGMERKFGFPPGEFRLWLALHEVDHRLQFGGAPWLRGYLSGMVESYLNSVEVDPKWLAERLKRAVEEVRTNRAEYRGFGWIFLLMSDDQREIVRRMQSMMSLLEGHATYVMNSVSREHVPAAGAFHRTLHERRNKRGIEHAFQKVIGFDVKARQYDLGEHFVSTVVDRVGMDRFNRVWDGPPMLPTMEEIARPEAWVARVAAG